MIPWMQSSTAQLQSRKESKGDWMPNKFWENRGGRQIVKSGNMDDIEEILESSGWEKQRLAVTFP